MQVLYKHQITNKLWFQFIKAIKLIVVYKDCEQFTFLWTFVAMDIEATLLLTGSVWRAMPIEYTWSVVQKFKHIADCGRHFYAELFLPWGGAEERSCDVVKHRVPRPECVDTR